MKYLIGIFFCVVSVISVADTHSGVGKVIEVWSGYQNGKVLFRLDVTHKNPKPCTANTYYAVDATRADSDKFMSMLLMAKASGAKVDVIMSDTECFSNYPLALRMGIKP